MNDSILFVLVAVVFVSVGPQFFNQFTSLLLVHSSGFRLKRLLWGAVDVSWNDVLEIHKSRASSSMYYFQFKNTKFMSIYKGYFIRLRPADPEAQQFLEIAEERKLLANSPWP